MNGSHSLQHGAVSPEGAGCHSAWKKTIPGLVFEGLSPRYVLQPEFLLFIFSRFLGLSQN